LENKVWDWFLDPNSSIGEKTAAFVTTNAMKAKRYFGMGLIKFFNLNFDFNF